MNLADWGIPNASTGVAKSEVANKWAEWLHNPCRLRGPQRFIARDKMSNGS